MRPYWGKKVAQARKDRREEAAQSNSSLIGLFTRVSQHFTLNSNKECIFLTENHFGITVTVCIWALLSLRNL